MSEDRRPMPLKPNDASALLSWVQDAARQVRLAWRLFRDHRVPMWVKLVPSAALVYVLSPVDFIMLPGLGQLDDLAVLLIGIKLFVELSPPDVVREHLLALGAHIKEWRVVDEKDGGPSVVIEGEYELEAPEMEEAET